MPKLNDTQTMLLSHASQRDNLSLYPLPDGKAAGPRVTKAIAALIVAGLAEERETNEPGTIAREEGDLAYGLYATEAGLAAIGVETTAPGSAATVVTEAAPAKQPRQTKAALVIGLLEGEGGATLPDLIAATGWLPHTTRAALTGLRKKGHNIAKDKRDGFTCYKVAA